MKIYKMKKEFLLTVVTLCIFGAKSENFDHVYRIYEEESAGDRLGHVANDSKLLSVFTPEEFRRLEFSLSSHSSASHFVIDKTSSELTTKEKIDREIVCPRKSDCELKFDVVVFMRDSNSEQVDLHSIVRLTVVILDINDNSPTFPSDSLTLTIPESDKVDQVLSISPASDLDTGVNNSVQTYSLIPDEGIFEVRVVDNVGGDTNLELVVKTALNREITDLYEFEIIAKDGGNPVRSGSVRVIVQVSDTNDNRPQFVKESFEVTVNENIALNTSFLTLEAKDSDAKLNGEMTFSFSSRTSQNVRNHFGINTESGEIYAIKTLDFETDSQFRFLVEVKDKGLKPLSSQAEVIINVADVNDNSPQIAIKVPGGVREVLEDSAVDAFIAHVNVFDADSTNNGEVTCSVDDNHFRVEKFTNFQYYKIYLQTPLDYETTKTLSVNISCTDKGATPRTNSSSFTVKVLDVNDNAPVFPKRNITTFLRENNQVDQLILTLSATDDDGPGNNDISYAIMDVSADLAYIDSKLGEIRAKESVNREQISSFKFTVEARDSGSPAMSSFVTVTVIIDDENDEPPTFSKPHFEFEVPEGRPANTLVGKLQAYDADASPRFVFSILNNQVSDIFSVNSASGEIFTSKTLDRFSENKYDLKVHVSNPDRADFNDTAEVTIYVVEDRSVPPAMSILYPGDTNGSVTFPADTKVGSVILKVVSQKQLPNDNRQVKFTIEHGNEDGLFQLDETAGNLTLIKSVPSSMAGKYKLLISSFFENNPGQKAFLIAEIIFTASPTTQDDGKGYIVIVIVIICVTAVLAGAIMLAICMMKRVDKERKECQRRKKEDMEKVYQVDNIDKLASPADDHVNVMVKPTLSFREEKPAKDKERDIIDPVSITLQAKKNVQFANDPVTKVEDDVSNLSAEADSGHGGSEEDFNGTGKFVFLPHDSDTSQLSPCECFDFRPETSILSSSSLQEWLVETPRRAATPRNMETPPPRISLPLHYETPPPRTNLSRNLETPPPGNYLPLADIHTRSSPLSGSIRDPPSRKSSARVGQKSVRFSLDVPETPDSNI